MKRLGRRAMIRSAVASGLAAPAIAAPEQQRVLRFMPSVDLVTLDPHVSMTNVTRNHGSVVFDQLYGTDGSFKAQPQMAEGHTIEDGGKTWRVKLREGLWFHDGEPVLARDCVASLTRWGKRDVLGKEVLARADEIISKIDSVI